MNAKPTLGVGIIGYGVMGKAHSYGYRVAPMLRRLPVTPVVTVMSGRDALAVEAAAAAHGVPATVTDWRELIARDDVDVVDICTPPGTHARMAREAAADDHRKAPSGSSGCGGPPGCPTSSPTRPPPTTGASTPVWAGPRSPIWAAT